jgi:chromosome segregation ATPase
MCITKIRKLEQSLETQEQYIKYLYITIEGHESEIEDLRNQNKKLRISLKDALSNISLKEEALQALEEQLVKAENKNLELRTRISEILQSARINMARANPDPVNLILNHYLPDITDRLQQIRQHTERTVPLTRPNLDNRYDQINRYLDQIRQGVAPLLNATQNLRNLANITAERDQYHAERDQCRGNLANITAERDQYQNLLNTENRLVADLRNQLHNSRNQYLNAYWNLRVNWQLAQDRKTRISQLLREKFAYILLNHQKTQQLQDSRGLHQQT